MTPRVAVLATCCFAGSHADVILTRLLEGYDFGGRRVTSRIEVAALYLEQQYGDSSHGPDVGRALASRNDVPLYPSVAEAMSCGGTGVKVDGVLIIGEHGDYGRSEYGQTLYPRRRLFDSAVSAMIASGHPVPIFNDKHLAWSYGDALAMYETARRLGIPLLAGSTLPLTWRVPAGSEWQLGAAMDTAALVGYGPVESYGFHCLEGLQAHVERRAGGESGVATVRGCAGPAAADEVPDVAMEVLARALGTVGVGEDMFDLRASVRFRFDIEYLDGLHGVVLGLAEQYVSQFGSACRGPHDELSCQLWLAGSPGPEHFVFLIRQIEELVLNGRAPYPVERTLLTTGVLAEGMRSIHEGGTTRTTPQLVVEYQATPAPVGSGIFLERPDQPD